MEQATAKAAKRRIGGGEGRHFLLLGSTLNERSSSNNISKRQVIIYGESNSLISDW